MTRPSAPILARLGVVGLAGLVGLAGVSLSACNVQNSNSAGSGVRDRDQDGYREDEDCDDTDPAIFPGADELCNGLDDDCDEEIDEEAVDAPSWHTDADGDGYGDPASSSLSCEEVSGAVQDDSDCDDTDDTVNPDGTEVCNDGLDNDCDGGFNDCALEAELDLASAGVRLLGEEAADLAGYSLAVLDMDGDLVDDIVVGAPGYDGDGGSSTGAAYTLMGPTSGTIGLSAADAAWEGPEEGELAGAAVAAAGDVNNDNLPDVLVGAPMASKEGSEVGVAYLLLGPATAGGSLEDADAILSGNSGLSQAGISLAGVGDMSGDGVDDIAIGASNSLGGAGEVYLLQGPLEGEISVGAANATLTGPFGAQAGTSLAPAGDLDGDGVPDLLVGATGVEIDGDQVGAVYVLHGPIVGDLALSAAAGGRILGVGDNDLLGRAVAGVGDVNGDGLDDLLAGAPADDTNGADAGAAFLFHGPATGTFTSGSADARLVGQHAEANAGWSVDGGVDLDQDGTVDLVVGAPGTNFEPEGGSGRSGAGAAYLLYGPVTGLVALSAADVVMGGASSQAEAGTAVRLSPDATGDAVPDILVGAPAKGNSSAEGSVWIVEGQGL